MGTKYYVFVKLLILYMVDQMSNVIIFSWLGVCEPKEIEINIIKSDERKIHESELLVVPLTNFRLKYITARIYLHMMAKNY